MPRKALTELEVYKLATANEQRGAAFYTAMAEKSQDQRTKNMFNKLAEEEKEHHRLFSELLRQAGEKPESLQLGGETSVYLSSLVENNVFPVDLTGPHLPASPKDALATGIQAEKDSILLYHELLQRARDSRVKDMLSKLLEEEKMHLVELREQYEEMS